MATPSLQEALAQVEASLQDFRVGLERAIPDPEERKAALAAVDEIEANLVAVRGSIVEIASEVYNLLSYGPRP